MESTSPNGKYQLCVSQGYIDDEKRVSDGVTLRNEGDIQFQKDLRAPSNGAVANNGTSVIIEGKNWDKPKEEWSSDDKFDIVYVYNAIGELIFKEKLDTPSGIFGCSIDATGSYVAISGIDEGDVLLYDVQTGEQILTKDYEEIKLAYEINTIQSGGKWLFELVDSSEQTSIFIDMTGEVIAESEVVSEEADGDNESVSDEPLAEQLERQDVSVPDTVFGLLFRLSGASEAEGSDKQRFKQIIEEGPIYDPEWSEYHFVVPDPPKVLYVLGPESKSEAAEALSTFCDIEQIDLSKWYQVTSTSGTMRPSSGDFETALRRTSRSESIESGVVTSDGTISLDEKNALDSLVHRVFFGTEPESDSSDSFETPASEFPNNEFGETLREVVSGECPPYSNHGVTSESGYSQLVNDSSTNQIIDGFPELLDLLESRTVFEPYSIDLRNARPSIQPLFDVVAKESPETVFQHLDRLEEHLLERRSITAPEVSCLMLQTVVEEHPDQFEKLVSLLDTVLESQSVHPQRRALDIIESGLRNGARESVAELEIATESAVNYLLKRMQATESAWLRAACFSVIHEYDLDSTDYGRLEEYSDLLIETLQFGRERRGETLSKGLGGPLMDVSTDEELLEEIRSPDPSSQALYVLNKHAAGPVIRDLASERPETVLLHLDSLMEDLTVEGKNLQEVRKVAKGILKSTVENLPKDQYDEPSKYDSEVLPLLDSDDRHDVNFALEWARKSGSEDAIKALTEIHENSSDDRWQRATAILEELAPDQVDSDIEPDNAYTEWIEFVSQLAEERGQLPASSDVREHPDSPDTPFWEVFDGWSDVLESLDIETTRRTSNAPLRQCLVADLQRVAEQVDGKPTTGDIEANSEYSYYDFKSEFGGIKAARDAADLE